LKILAALSVSVVFAAGCALGQDSQQPPASQTPPSQNSPSQNQAPPSGTSSSSSSSSAPSGPKERRFSGGVTLEVNGLHLVDGRTFTNYTSTELNTQYQTSNDSQRIGYGLTVQARVKGRFYLNVSGLLHRLAYQETTTVSTTVTEVLNGSTYPQVTTTSTQENTHSRLIDIPVLVRYYGAGKHPSSPRWFVELGGEYQTLSGIRTSISSTDASGNVTCCTNAAAVPDHHGIKGAVAGAGIQFTDEFGIHVIPEVRYTRWYESNFNSLSTSQNRQQVEADLSITF
jgi:opacity protein-like surface antigen